MGIIEKIVVDDATMQDLADKARAHGRTIEDEAAETLRWARSPFRSREDMIAEMDRIAAMTPKGVAQTDSTILVREDRDR